MKTAIAAIVIAIAALTGCATQTHSTTPPNPFYTLGQTEAHAALTTNGYPGVNGNASEWCEVLWNGLSETTGIPAPNESAEWTLGCMNIAK
jgi:hypothetical protein